MRWDRNHVQMSGKIKLKVYIDIQLTKSCHLGAALWIFEKILKQFDAKIVSRVRKLDNWSQKNSWNAHTIFFCFYIYIK